MDPQASPVATAPDVATTQMPSPRLPWDKAVTKALGVLALASVAVAAVLLLSAKLSPFGAVPSQVFLPSSFSVVSGKARLDGPRLIVDRLGANEKLVVIIPRARLRATDHRAIELRIRGLDNDEKLAFVWRTEHSGGRTFLRPVDAVSEGGVGTSLRDDRNWNGDVTGLGFVVSGPSSAPLVIESIRVVSNSALANAWETIQDWLTLRTWNGNTINVLTLRSDLNPLSLSSFAAASVAVALIAWWVMRRRDRFQLAAGSLAIIAFAWLVLDARWLGNFTRQVAATSDSYAGKTWRDKRLAAADGALFDFLEQAKATIAQRPGRVMFGSDDAYIRSRAGYHLLPVNTLSNVYHGELHGHRFLQPGDYLCVYGKSGIEFDPATGSLRWESAPPLRAERVLDKPPGVLYRILP